MNAQQIHQRHNDRSRARHPSRAKKAIQFIYAHLPPAIILATAQHLRTQTQIEQRAQQLWFANRDDRQSALDHWLRAERDVVRELCEALLHGNIREPEPSHPSF